jgi:hypothetical protein
VLAFVFFQDMPYLSIHLLASCQVILAQQSLV